MKNCIFICFFFLFLSCENNSTSDLIDIPSPEATLNLKWNKAYPDDNIDKSLIGLKWALSYVGATLPVALNGISNSETSITISIDRLGFSPTSVEQLSKLHRKIKASEEYQVNNNIDLGRYVSLLIGASEHYYEISGTPKRLENILNMYTLKPEKGYVNNSNVSFEHRIVQFSEQNDFNQVFLSEEIDPITKEIFEYETIELLPNGQLRFGIFDKNGDRINAADPSHSAAGKPAKCMWCHESTINQMFSPQVDFVGYLTATDFQNILIGYRDSHRAQKLALIDGVDFSRTQQHTLTELLYISFMEPSAERLSIEWNLPIAEIQSRLSGFSTHIYEEFPFLGELYFRKDIENLAPLEGLSVSSSVRESSLVEVNHLSE
jgi:hypothetical protein